MLGRTVGTFAAAQTAGLMLAPILGGLLGEISWRLAFVLVAVVAVVLALPRQTLGAAERQAGANGRASLRSLLNRWIALLGAQALLGYLGFTAIGFVLVLVGAEEFDLSSSARGLLIAGYGVGGILLGRYAGTVVDRAGRPATALAGAIACTAGVLGLVVAPGPWSLGLVFFGVGCASAFVWAGLNTIAVESFPGEPRRRDLRLQRLQVRRGGDRAARLRSSLRVDTRLPFLLAAGFSALLAVSLICPGSGATDEAPGRRPRLRAGRVLPGHDPPARARAGRQRLGAEHVGRDGRGRLRRPAGGRRAARRVRPSRARAALTSSASRCSRRPRRASRASPIR